MLVEITSKNFEEVVNNATKPVLIDFWASWCGPCRMMGPVIEEIAQDLGEEAVVGKINIDIENGLASKHNVMTIPTLAVFKNGQETKRFIGVTDKNKIIAEMK